VNEEEYLYEDEDGTYKEEVVGEEIPTDDGLVGDKPVEDKGKAVDHAQPSLLAMWYVNAVPALKGGVPLLDKGSGISKSHLRPTTEKFAFYGSLAVA